MIKKVIQKLLEPKDTSRGDIDRPFDLESIDLDDLGELDLDLFSQPQNPFFHDLVQMPCNPEDDYTGIQFFHDPEELELSAQNENIEVGYDTAKGKLLLERCGNHRTKFRQTMPQQGVILVVHPLYTLFEHRERLCDESYKRLVAEYVTKLCRLVENRNRDRYALVIMEMAEHYAMFTSFLLEAGLVDDVIFTKHDHGTPLNESQVANRVRSPREIVVCGSYLEYCFESGVNSITAFKDKGELFHAPEIILPADITIESPRDVYRRVVNDQGLNPANWVSVNSLCRRYTRSMPAYPVSA